MAEIVAILQTLSAAAQLVETAIRILRRLTTAYESQKDLVLTLGRYKSDLESIRSILGIIEDEEALRTAMVSSEVLRLRDIEDKLVQHLKQFDTRRRAVREFAHQLIHHSSEEKKLAAIMDDLCQVKTALLLRIQVAAVGVTRTVGDGLLANTETVGRIEKFLQDELGVGVELKIARLLKGRRPSNDGTVFLTRAELVSLSSNDTPRHDEPEGTPSSSVATDETISNAKSASMKKDSERLTVGNLTKDQALMICGPIGKDLWEQIGRVEVSNNKAEGNSTMVAYATSLETLSILMDRQDRRIEASLASRERSGRAGSSSFQV